MPWSGGIYRKANYATNGWTGDASNNIGIESGRHDNQDDDFMTGINACLNKAGQNTPTANLPMGGFKHTGCADASANDQYATYGQVTTGVATVTTPAGIISMYGGTINPPTNNPPSGWLYCDGVAYSRTSYAALFAVIGTTFGVGDGTTTFNVPNMQQRFPLGKAASGTGATLGGTGGSIDHTHTSAAHTHTIASHSHTIAAHSHTVNSHTHSLSDAGGAKITGGGTPSDTIMYRTSISTWTANLTTSPDVPWATPGTAPTTSNVAGLIGSTDAASTATGTTALTTDGTSLTTDSTTPGVTGPNNPPFLVVNFIIKT